MCFTLRNNKNGLSMTQKETAKRWRNITRTLRDSQTRSVGEFVPLRQSTNKGPIEKTRGKLKKV